MFFVLCFIIDEGASGGLRCTSQPHSEQVVMNYLSVRKTVADFCCCYFLDEGKTVAESVTLNAFIQASELEGTISPFKMSVQISVQQMVRGHSCCRLKLITAPPHQHTSDRRRIKRATHPRRTFRVTHRPAESDLISLQQQTGAVTGNTLR